MVDGKTYYYLFDKYHIMHICSDGMTRCGKKINESYSEVLDKELKYIELCSTCQVPDRKVATFETKAEFIEGDEL